jgi:hypothetical protein
LVKDLRARLSNGDPAWQLNRANYTVEQAANRLKKFFEDICQAVYAGPPPPGVYLGFDVAGYSAGGERPEVWQFEIHDGSCKMPVQVNPGLRADCFWHGQAEPLNRLLHGYDHRIRDVLDREVYQRIQHIPGVPALDDLLKTIKADPHVNPYPMYTEAMTVQAAIDLAEFLVQTAIGVARFSPHCPVVGPPIAIAGITQHEGFRWVKRNRWFDPALGQEP